MLINMVEENKKKAQKKESRKPKVEIIEEEIGSGQSLQEKKVEKKEQSKVEQKKEQKQED